MNKLFVSANRWVKESDWKDIALLKCCLGAMGMLIGLAMPRKRRLPVVLVTLGVFVATYVPLMGRFVGIWADEVGKPCPQDSE